MAKEQNKISTSNRNHYNDDYYDCMFDDSLEGLRPSNEVDEDDYEEWWEERNE